MQINANKKEEEVWDLESALDVLIVLLYSEGPKGKVGEAIEGITRLDKIMYLLSKTKEFSPIVNQSYNFQADNFGPFAPELFDDIQVLKHEGVIRASEKEAKNKIQTIDEESVEKIFDEAKNMSISWKQYSIERYELTELGTKIGIALFKGLSESQKETIKTVKKKFGEMNLKNLLYYVYSKYPKMTANSIIREKILQ